MDPSAIERAAELLAQVRQTRQRLGRLPEDCRPADLGAAYAVQDALHHRLAATGWGALAGHKIGCTTPVMQRFLGIGHPCAGGVFAPTVQHERGKFRHADFLHVGVECEIAVRLARDLPARAAPYARSDVADAVGACLAAIEVVDDRYADYRALDTPTLVADDFFNAACVLGTPVEDWRALDLAALRGRMTINGAEVGTGRGGDILGHPLEALAWLANASASRGQYLKTGEFVLLGSVVETRWVEQGDVVEASIEGLGTAYAEFGWP
jgi:2-oxo-3-hexenedioate decarboxylase/2-keto-4-pentenoate hydratase